MVKNRMLVYGRILFQDQAVKMSARKDDSRFVAQVPDVVGRSQHRGGLAAFAE